MSPRVSPVVYVYVYVTLRYVLVQRYGVGDGAREERGVGHQQPHLCLLDAQSHKGAPREIEIEVCRELAPAMNERFIQRGIRYFRDAQFRSLSFLAHERTHARTPLMLVRRGRERLFR